MILEELAGLLFEEYLATDKRIGELQRLEDELLDSNDKEVRDRIFEEVKRSECELGAYMSRYYAVAKTIELLREYELEQLER